VWIFTWGHMYTIYLEAYKKCNLKFPNVWIFFTQLSRNTLLSSLWCSTLSTFHLLNFLLMICWKRHVWKVHWEFSSAYSVHTYTYLYKFSLDSFSIYSLRPTIYNVRQAILSCLNILYCGTRECDIRYFRQI
jgi:hypothetical protein